MEQNLASEAQLSTQPVETSGPKEETPISDEDAYENAEPPSFQNGRMGNTLVTVLVGPELKAFHIHKALLCHFSPYFRAAIAGSFKEGKEGLVSLPDVPFSADAFSIFAEWLYHRNPKSLDDLISLSILADRCDVPLLRRHAIDQLYEFHSGTKSNGLLPRFSSVTFAFEHLPESSSVCRMYVDVHVEYWNCMDDDENDVEERKKLPQEFALAVMIGLSAKLANTTPTFKKPFSTGGVCKYHEHKSDEERKDCKK